MGDIPLFFPTSKGDVAGIVSLPDNGEVGDTAVLLLTGDAHARTRVGVLRRVAHDLAPLGLPTLRFDYPGAGLSTSQDDVPHEDLATVATEAATWFLGQTGCKTLMTAGHCLGARLALFVAASNEAVTRSVAVGCPIRKRQVVRSQLRARVAATSRLGGMLSGVLTGGSRAVDTGAGWYPGLVEELTAASRHANLAFIYGSEDVFHVDLLELLDELDPTVASKVTVSVREGTQLRALTELDDHPWVISEIEKLLGHSVEHVSHA